MTLRTHRIAAVSLWMTGLVVLLVWGQSMAVESDAIRRDRDRFAGSWVSTLIQVGTAPKLADASAGVCRAEFVGNQVIFHNLIEQTEAKGTVTLDNQAIVNRIDFKLDAGWILGVYEFDGETLKIAMNPLAPSERLGVTIRPRPREVKPAAGVHYYEFRLDRDPK